MSQRFKNGLTLAELLVVVAILAILLGIILPVMIRSTRSSKLTDDINHLRQLGIAAEIYSNETGIHPGYIKPLIGTTKGVESLLNSKLDPTPMGWVNAHFDSEGISNPAILNSKYDQKVSYFGLYDLLPKIVNIESFKATGNNAGWLICVSPNEKYYVNQPTKMLSGAHYRLTFEGSIIRRASNIYGNRSSIVMLFRDFTDEERRNYYEENP